MSSIEITTGDLVPELQAIVSGGFARHTAAKGAPPFAKSRLNWLARNSQGELVGVLTGDLLWDWFYIDELWVDESQRGTGLGKKLMSRAEEYAAAHTLTGLWLWTQSWQAAAYYERLGYREFTRFPDFPKGHFRVGLRKQLAY